MENMEHCEGHLLRFPSNVEVKCLFIGGLENLGRQFRKCGMGSSMAMVFRCV